MIFYIEFCVDFSSVGQRIYCKNDFVWKMVISGLSPFSFFLFHSYTDLSFEVRAMRPYLIFMHPNLFPLQIPICFSCSNIDCNKKQRRNHNILESRPELRDQTQKIGRFIYVSWKNFEGKFTFHSVT